MTCARSVRLAVAASLLVLFVASAPVFAASKEVERLQIQVATLQSQLTDVQRTVADNAKEMKRLSDLLGEQNAALRKALQDEKLDNEATQVALKEISERLAQIAERIAPGSVPPVVAPTGAPAAGPGPSATLPPPPGAATPLPGELFSQAYADYTRGQYDLAVQEFREYLKRFPSSDRADSAQYWIGVSLAGKQKWTDALEAFDALLQNFPSSDRLPDTHVKRAGVLEKLGHRREALTEYRYVVEHFPNSPAAKIARDKLGS